MSRLFSSRQRILVILAPIYTAIAIALSAIGACRGCDVAGVFYFCSDEGPHQVIQDPPVAWRARMAEVQEQLAQYSAAHFPDSTFQRKDPNRVVFYRVLGHGIPGGAMRTAGDSIFMNVDDEGNPGDMRHEIVHWVQPDNLWLERDGRGRTNIHYPPIFDFVRAPLIAD